MYIYIYIYIYTRSLENHEKTRLYLATHFFQVMEKRGPKTRFLNSMVFPLGKSYWHHGHICHIYIHLNIHAPIHGDINADECIDEYMKNTHVCQ